MSVTPHSPIPHVVLAPAPAPAKSRLTPARRSDLPRRVARGLSAGLVLLLAGHLFRYYYLNFTSHPFAYRLVDKFNFNAEQTLPAWYASALLLAAGGIAVAIHLRLPRPHPDAWRWLLAGVLLAAMSADETVSLHEMVGSVLKERVATSGLFYFSWVLVAIPLLVVATATFLPLLRRLPLRTRTGLITAAALYFGGAVGTEMIGGLIAERIGFQTAAFFAVSTVEETLETAGLIVAVVTLLAYALRITPPGPGDTGRVDRLEA